MKSFFKLLLLILLVSSCSFIHQNTPDKKAEKPKADAEKKSLQIFDEQTTSTIEEKTEDTQNNEIQNIKYRETKIEQTNTSDSDAVPDFINPFYQEPPYESSFSKVLVSVSTNGSIPIKDLINEIAKTSGLDIIIEKEISKSAVIKMDNKPVEYIIRAITKISDLAYKKEDGLIYISANKKVTETYHLRPMAKCSAQNCNSRENLISIEKNINFIIQNNELTRGDEIRTSIDTSTGIILVNALGKTHKLIEKYIKEVKETNNLQAMVSIKILQISLNSDYRDGKSPGIFSNICRGFNSKEECITSEENIEAIMENLKKFGSVKTILNSHIRATNNNISNIRLFKNIEGIGNLLSFSLLPVIDSEEATVSLNLNPIKYMLFDTNTSNNDKPQENIEDSTTANNSKSLSGEQEYNDHNLIQKQIARTRINLRHGDTALLFGLTNAKRETEGVDFGSTQKEKKSETLVLIKANIVDNNQDRDNH